MKNRIDLEDELLPGMKEIAALSVGIFAFVSFLPEARSSLDNSTTLNAPKIELTLQTYSMPANVWKSFSMRCLTTPNTLPESALSKLKAYTTNVITVYADNQHSVDVDSHYYACMTPDGGYLYGTDGQSLCDKMRKIDLRGTILQLGQETKLTPAVLSPKVVQVAVSFSTSGIGDTNQIPSPFVANLPVTPAASPILSFAASVSTILRLGQANIVLDDQAGNTVRVDIITCRMK